MYRSFGCTAQWWLSPLKKVVLSIGGWLKKIGVQVRYEKNTSLALLVEGIQSLKK